MLEALRARASFANIAAALALFVAIGGTAWALGLNTVGSPQVKNNSLRGKDLKEHTFAMVPKAKHAVSAGDVDGASINTFTISKEGGVAAPETIGTTDGRSWIELDAMCLTFEGTTELTVRGRSPTAKWDVLTVDNDAATPIEPQQNIAKDTSAGILKAWSDSPTFSLHSFRFDIELRGLPSTHIQGAALVKVKHESLLDDCRAIITTISSS